MDPDYKICHRHDGTIVLYANSHHTECPLCRALSRRSEVEQILDAAIDAKEKE